MCTLKTKSRNFWGDIMDPWFQNTYLWRNRPLKRGKYEAWKRGRYETRTTPISLRMTYETLRYHTFFFRPHTRIATEVPHEVVVYQTFFCNMMKDVKDIIRLILIFMLLGREFHPSFITIGFPFMGWIGWPTKPLTLKLILQSSWRLMQKKRLKL